MRKWRSCEFTILWMASGMFLNLWGGTVYNESIAGDLSNNGLAPTTLTFTAGSNQVLGSTGRPSTAIDRDYFTFTVAAGLRLSSIIFLPGSAVGGSFSFFGIESGNQVTLPTNTPTAAGLLGWWHYSPADINTDILSKAAVPSNGSSGFTPPLGPGTYSVWIQDFNAGTVNYGFDFQLTSTVPEPSTSATVAAALLLIALSSSAGAKKLSALVPCRSIRVRRN